MKKLKFQLEILHAQHPAAPSDHNQSWPAELNLFQRANKKGSGKLFYPSCTQFSWSFQHVSVTLSRTPWRKSKLLRHLTTSSSCRVCEANIERLWFLNSSNCDYLTTKIYLKSNHSKCDDYSCLKVDSHVNDLRKSLRSVFTIFSAIISLPLVFSLFQRSATQEQDSFIDTESRTMLPQHCRLVSHLALHGVLI